MTQDTQNSPGGQSQNGNMGPEIAYHVQSQYLKDLSFEIPQPDHAFGQGGPESENNINLEIEVHPKGQNAFDVSLKIKITSDKEGKPVFIFELCYAGVFVIEKMPENILQPFLYIQCPNYLYPFIRSIVRNTASEGGFHGLLLPPVDFAQLYAQRMQEAMAAAGHN